MNPRLQSIADRVIPWGVGIFLVLVVAGDNPADEARGLTDLLGLGLAIAQGVALHFRRRRPERALAVAIAGTVGFCILYPEVVLPIAGIFAIFTLTSLRPQRTSLLWLGALLAATSVNFAVAKLEDSIFALALVVAAWALGEAARSRHDAIDQGAQRAVAEEQARIARELHDVVAHTVSVIVVQAAAADDVFDERPDQARAALRAIEGSAREALAELRRLLAAVRPGAAEDPDRPQPGLDRLEELAAPLRAGGLDVSIREQGQAQALPPGVDLSAYRIVQEALTNTLRHAHAGRADVTITYGADAVEVDVRDDGRATATNGDGGGQGLMGMRERAALLGGTVTAGPAPGGGFRVHARLPVEAAS